MEGFLELAARRQSCRDFDPCRAVEKEKLTRMAETARLSPSACNNQPWRYYIVSNPETVRALRPLMSIGGMNPFVKDCPCFGVIAQWSFNQAARAGTKVSGQSFAPMDIGLSAAHFVLAAEELGVGTCILGAFRGEKVQQLLGVPKDWRVCLALAIGYPRTEEVRPKQRRDLDQVAVLVE